MPTFFDLLKYAKTGISSPEMTAYDKLKAMALCGGGLSPYTIIGQPPISFKSDGTPLTSVTIKGNGQQNGTPSQQNIVPFDGTGERTANLWNYTIEQGGWNASSGEIPTKYVSDDPKFTIRCGSADIIPIPSNTMSFTCQSDVDVKFNFVWINTNGVSLGGSGWQQNGSTVTAPEDATAMTFILAKVDDSTCSPNDFQNIMLNTGSTPLPYEPYGYKIPLTNASVTTPLYLGEVSTTRRIKKLVFDGTENWRNSSDGNIYISLSPNQGVSWITVISTHFTPSQVQTNGNLLWFVNAKVDFDNAEECKIYLAQQYAAGHPVVVWYVLATEQTGIVNEPLMKIGDYADELTTDTPIPTAKGSNTLSVDTTVQPSEVSITGNIKPTT